MVDTQNVKLMSKALEKPKFQCFFIKKVFRTFLRKLLDKNRRCKKSGFAICVF